MKKKSVIKVIKNKPCYRNKADFMAFERAINIYINTYIMYIRIKSNKNAGNREKYITLFPYVILKSYKLKLIEIK